PLPGSPSVEADGAHVADLGQREARAGQARLGLGEQPVRRVAVEAGGDGDGDVLALARKLERPRVGVVVGVQDDAVLGVIEGHRQGVPVPGDVEGDVHQAGSKVPTDQVFRAGDRLPVGVGELDDGGHVVALEGDADVEGALDGVTGDDLELGEVDLVGTVRAVVGDVLPGPVRG